MASYRGLLGRPGSGSGSSDSTKDEMDTSGDPSRPSSPAIIFNPYYTGSPRTPSTGSKQPSVDRQEIIRRIKSRESRPNSPELSRPTSSNGRKRTSPKPSSLVDSSNADVLERQSEQASLGIEIERPRSALHRGDFTDKDVASSSAFEHFGDAANDESLPSLSTSPVAPWHPNFPATIFRQVREERQKRRSPSPPSLPVQRARQRAASSSLATSFEYRHPTSPLVQSSRPDTPEPPNARNRSRSPDKSRRHTFSPPALRAFSSALDYPASARTTKQPPALRPSHTFPYQAHQPRRSLHNITPSEIPSTPRRPSITNGSPLLAPMVGSYEESILRGRMSTTPSKPLNFVASIGVLGTGSACKGGLKCPPHVSVPFPAVFYSYGAGAGAVDSGPSPYVGLVDLENSLPHPTTTHRHARTSRESDSTTRTNGPRRALSPPGGCYRIPPTGQIQLIIANPNKTAVKLFLVPYDLSDMPVGTKTFIRQRSYSTSSEPKEKDRPVLRYLVHLNLCCTGKGRYWLYKSVRVVFANRVMEGEGKGKEGLRCEVQFPEPRYSTYKSGREPAATPAHDVSWSPPPQQRTRRELAKSLPAAANDFVFESAVPAMPTGPLPQFYGSRRTPEREEADGESQESVSPREISMATDKALVFGRESSREREKEKEGSGGQSLLSMRLRREEGSGLDL